jgi:hypothetical protein
MNKLQRLLGVGLVTAATIGLAGCATVEEQKYRNITEFIPDKPVETRVVDVNKDGYLDMVYLTKSKEGDYLLKMMKANNNGSFMNPQLIRNYGKVSPQTLNWLTFFYHDISKVIEGKVR